MPNVPGVTFDTVAPDLAGNGPASPTRLSGLPSLPRALVGRSRESARLLDLLGHASTRLVTLTGPGGVGKTTLSLHVGRAAAEAGRDAAFVELAAISDPAAAGSAIARALRISPGYGPTEDWLAAAIDDRPLLLIIDNAEHVVSGLGFLPDLLARKPNLAVLVTSRVPLDAPGELEVELAPLAIAPEGTDDPATAIAFDAVRFFIACAVRVDPAFSLDAGNAAAVADICRHLDGLPLALELAAAQSQVLPPRALLDRLRRHRPLPRLVVHDIPARQRTIEDAIQWSYGLLSPDEQRLFRRLAIFQSPWTVDAASAVAGPDLADAPDLHRRLVHHHLLHPAAEAGDQPRFTMLQTIASFARSLLAEDAAEERAAADRHADWFLAQATAANLGMALHESVAVDALERQARDYVAAAEWLLRSGRDADAMRLVIRLRFFWRATERHSLAIRILSPMPDAADALSLVDAADGHDLLACLLFDRDGEAALDWARDLVMRSRAFYEAAGVSTLQAEHDHCFLMLLAEQDVSEAARCFGRYLDRPDVMERPDLVAGALLNIAECIQLGADLGHQDGEDVVPGLYRRSSDIAGARGDPTNYHVARINLASLLAARIVSGEAGPFAEAERNEAWAILRRSIPALRGSLASYQIITMLAAALLLLSDEPAQAALLLGTAERLGDELGMGVIGVEALRRDMLRRELSRRLGPGWEAAAAAGKPLSTSAALDLIEALAPIHAGP